VMTLREITNQVMPPLVWNIWRRMESLLRRLGILETPQADPEILRRIYLLEKTHRAQNSGCEPDEIVVRPGLRLKIHPNSRVAFEPFCYQRPDMVDELSNISKLPPSVQEFLSKVEDQTGKISVRKDYLKPNIARRYKDEMKYALNAVVYGMPIVGIFKVGDRGNFVYALRVGACRGGSGGRHVTQAQDAQNQRNGTLSAASVCPGRA